MRFVCLFLALFLLAPMAHAKPGPFTKEVFASQNESPRFVVSVPLRYGIKIVRADESLLFSEAEDRLFQGMMDSCLLSNKTDKPLVDNFDKHLHYVTVLACVQKKIDEQSKVDRTLEGVTALLVFY